MKDTEKYIIDKGGGEKEINKEVEKRTLEEFNKMRRYIDRANKVLDIMYKDDEM